MYSAVPAYAVLWPSPPPYRDVCLSSVFAWVKGLEGRLGVRFGGSNRDNLGGHLEGQNGSKMGVSKGG